MSAGLNHGFRYGYVTVIGLVLGIWTQLLVVGVGLGALVAASGTAFAVVKWLGVGYLVWLGI
jgi:homoserine/homoserine lactone efflux protein